SRRMVRPETELVLQIAPGPSLSASLRGRLLETDGSPATRIDMTGRPPDGDPGWPLRIEQDGRFTTGPCRPGRLRIVAEREGRMVADLGEHDLHPHQNIDLGDVHLPVPGGVLLAIRGGDATGGVVDLFRNGERLDNRR